MMKKFEKIKNSLVYLLLFLLPWQTRWIFRSGELNGDYLEYGTVSLYMTEVLLWAALALYLAPKIKLENFKFQISNFRSIFNFKFLISKNRYLLFVICYLLLVISYLLLIGLFAIRPTLHYYYLVRLAEGVGLYFLIKSVDWREASWIFIAGIIPQAALGIYQFLTQSSFASSWLGMAAHDPSALGAFVIETASGRWLRAYGALPHPNVLGAYLVVAIMLLANLMFNIYNKKFQISPRTRACGAVRGRDFDPAGHHPQGDRFQNKLFVISYLLLVIFSAALFFSFSRSAWLALFISLLVYWFINRNKKAHILYSIFYILVTIIILSSVFREPLLSRVHGNNRLETKSKIERLTGYKEAWQIFVRHPLVGVGLGSYTYAAHKEIDSARPSYAYQPVHNIFVLLAVELGIVGILGLFLLFLFKCIKARSPTLIFISTIVIVLGLFDHYLISLYPGIMLLFSALALSSESR